MNKWLVLTICILTGLGLIIWDIFLAIDKVGGNTISEIIKYVSYYVPTLPVLMGFVCGHLFLNKPFRKMPYIKIQYSMLILLGLILKSFIISAFVTIQPWIYFLISFFMGGIFWTQREENTGLGWLLRGKK